MISFREIDPIEQPPKIEGAICHLAVYTLFGALTVLPAMITLWVWYRYGFWIGVGIGLFGYLVSGFAGSKLRQMSLPPDQRERTLSSLQIAKWYIGTNHCLK